jgi:hypothetical protein
VLSLSLFLSLFGVTVNAVRSINTYYNTLTEAVRDSLFVLCTFFNFIFAFCALPVLAFGRLTARVSFEGVCVRVLLCDRRLLANASSNRKSERERAAPEVWSAGDTRASILSLGR